MFLLSYRFIVFSPIYGISEWVDASSPSVQHQVFHKVGSFRLTLLFWILKSRFRLIDFHLDGFHMVGFHLVREKCMFGFHPRALY